MKPNKMLRWVVLTSVGPLLAACGGGVTTLGSGDDPGMGTGGSGMGGSKSGIEAGKGGIGSTAGKTSGTAGTGANPGSELCMTDTDCTDHGAPCELCGHVVLQEPRHRNPPPCSAHHSPATPSAASA